VETEEDLELKSPGDQSYAAVRDITMELKDAEKIALIGKVGSGKTSLLLTLLNELCIVKGSM
jgi:ABC-type transport system involved in cytochrome bd biosynthesis fused ATPase/permease subunit